MNHEIIRPIEGEELLQVVYQLPGYSFRSSPPLQEAQSWQSVLDERVGTQYLALYEKEQPTACVARAPMTQQVRGKVLPMGGVFDVVTHPTARRKGYARQLMQKTFTALYEEGRPLTSLYPFRESFYERLGYVSFLQPVWAKLVPANLGGLLKLELDGEIELALLSDCFDRYHDFLQKVQLQQQGMGLFQNRPLAPGKRQDKWVAMAMLDGEVAGVVLYDLRGEREMEFDLRAFRFYYLDRRARYLMLDWIARHVDQARSVEILLPPSEHPETWLVDLQLNITLQTFCGMGRVLDIAALSGIQAGQGVLSVRVQDPYCPWNEGCWRLEGDGSTLQITQVSEADCTLTIQGFSALVYGAQDPGDFVFRGWGDPDTEQIQTLRALFPHTQPYLHEFF